MRSENGSAIVYVFIGVALFGALMFAFTRGGSQNTSDLSAQQAKIVASEMLEYSRTVETAVNGLLNKGCSENELSFENTFESGYANASAPINKSCHVFDPAGGRLKYKYPPKGAETAYVAGAPAPGWKNYAFNGNMQILNLGSTSTELIFWTQTNKAICDQINLGLGKTTADDTYGNNIIDAPYTGSFATAGPAVIGDEAYAPALSKGCFNQPTHSGQYIFYAVLVAR